MLLELARYFQRRSSPWAGRIVAHNNRFVYTRNKVFRRNPDICDDPDLQIVRNIAKSRPTDISDHLETIYLETKAVCPKLIVELGTRGGESTRSLQAAAEANSAIMVSVDLDNCSSACSYKNWHFVQDDDIHFARVFNDWCHARGITPKIDLLFIDTSHEYRHTVAEIAAWFPHLSPNCTVMFHDTNMGSIYRRKDGSFGPGWDNERGVVSAIEEFLGIPLDEKRYFDVVRDDWHVRGWPFSSGLMILARR